MYKFKNRSYKNKVIQVISLLAVFSSLGAAQSKVKINTETESEIVILNSNFKTTVKGKGKKSSHTNTENNDNSNDEEAPEIPEEENPAEEVPNIPEEIIPIYIPVVRENGIIMVEKEQLGQTRNYIVSDDILSSGTALWMMDVNTNVENNNILNSN